MITQKELKKILFYNPDTGIFTWKVNRGTNKTKNKIAGYISNYGYILIAINRKSYFGHRLAWLYVYGNWPKKQIDHIDHNRSNNKINNLRDVSHIENSFNTKKHKNNKSGVNGVHYEKNRKSLKKWRAEIQAYGKRHRLGYFKYKNEAIKARKLAEKQYGFHKNHGL